jgi:hypothetical protein
MECSPFERVQKNKFNPLFFFFAHSIKNLTPPWKKKKKLSHHLFLKIILDNPLLDEVGLSNS